MDKTSKKFVCSHCGEELNEVSQLVSEGVEFIEQCYSTR